MSEYVPTGISFAYKKLQPSVMLFVCPVCGVKHEKETNCISYEDAFCDIHYLKMQKRKSALSILQPWDKPTNQEAYDDMYDHVKWLKIADGIEQ